MASRGSLPAAAALYVLGNIGGVGAWLTGPARVAFVIGLDRYFPPAFGQVHPRWKTPYVAILTQAVLATVFLLLSVLGKGTTVEKAYLILLDTMLLIYFIPYIYLFLSYLADRLGATSRRITVPRGRRRWSSASAVCCSPRSPCSSPPFPRPTRGPLAVPAQGHRRAALFVLSVEWCSGGAAVETRPLASPGDISGC